MALLRIFIVIFGFVLSSFAFAEDSILLKNGTKVTGKIVQKSDKAIVMDTGAGTNVTYYSDEIKSFSQQPATPKSTVTARKSSFGVLGDKEDILRLGDGKGVQFTSPPGWFKQADSHADGTVSILRYQKDKSRSQAVIDVTGYKLVEEKGKAVEYAKEIKDRFVRIGFTADTPQETDINGLDTAVFTAEKPGKNITRRLYLFLIDRNIIFLNFIDLQGSVPENLRAIDDLAHSARVINVKEDVKPKGPAAALTPYLGFGVGKRETARLRDRVGIRVSPPFGWIKIGNVDKEKGRAILQYQKDKSGKVLITVNQDPSQGAATAIEYSRKIRDKLIHNGEKLNIEEPKETTVYGLKASVMDMKSPDDKMFSRWYQFLIGDTIVSLEYTDLLQPRQDSDLKDFDDLAKSFNFISMK